MTFTCSHFQGQFRGRPEVTDQREKYLQRLQQVQQQQGNLLNASHITGINQKQFPTQQPNSLLQQVVPAFTNKKCCHISMSPLVKNQEVQIR